MRPAEFEVAVPTPILVTDQDGQALAGVEFYGSNWMGEWDQLRSVKLPGSTGADGIYQFAFDEIGPREMIWGFKRGYALVQAFPEEYNSGETLRLVARPAITVRGIVRNEAGNPVANAIVRIESEPDDDQFMEDIVLTIRSDSLGRYHFPNLGPGLTYVGAETDSDWSEMVEIEMDGSQKEVVRDLILEAMDGGSGKPPAQPK